MLFASLLIRFILITRSVQASINGAVILSMDMLNISNATLAFDDPLLSSRASARHHHAKQLIEEISVCRFDKWYGVFTSPCPSSMHKHFSERGLALAHYNIWLDFIYFDPIVSGNITACSKIGDNEFENRYGQLYKNGKRFQDNDIIIILEDDADIFVTDINKVLRDELQEMTTDVLYLGWCEGRNARPVPLCSHAYALTRGGTRKLVHYYEPCGKAIDEQFVIMAKNNWISYRKVNPSSYKSNYRENYPIFNEKTFGIFHQKNIGSLNGH